MVELGGVLSPLITIQAKYPNPPKIAKQITAIMLAMAHFGNRFLLLGSSADGSEEGVVGGTVGAVDMGVSDTEGDTSEEVGWLSCNKVPQFGQNRLSASVPQ